MTKVYRQKGLVLHVLFKGLKEIQEKNNSKEAMSKIVKKIIEVDESSKLIMTLK
jgi:fructose-1,6-bisphosphatase